jgi:ATP-dependent Lon protease
MSDALDEKLIEAFPGKVVRKDLLQQIKKGSNVPSFVLEFLLAKYCASEDETEIEAGKVAALETLQKNYVRPDEANKAQSMVQQKGRHKFIDKIHVRYSEKEKRHWAEMENFQSKRIAVNERFYRDNDRLLEGGIWAEVTVGHNDVEEDDYAFLIEDLRPVQLSRFDFDAYCEGRSKLTRDEWIDVLMRSIGLEPSKMTQRLKYHFLTRLIPFVEQNYNLIELGPRGNGKSFRLVSSHLIAL